jgi:hypothetical protein
MAAMQLAILTRAAGLRCRRRRKSGTRGQARPRPAPTQISILDDILGLARLTQHLVGQAEQPRPFR